MKTACGNYEWMVGPLVDGELPEAEAAEVERHLRQCSSCARLAEDFRSFDHLARRRQDPPPPVSSTEWTRVLERIRRRPAVIPFGARRILDWMVPALSLAALALLGALSIVVVSMEPDSRKIDSAAIEASEKKSPAGPAQPVGNPGENAGVRGRRAKGGEVGGSEGVPPAVETR